MKKPTEIGFILRRYILWNITIMLLLLTESKLSANPFTVSLPNDTVICYNSNISISASYLYNSGPVKWKWNNGDSTQMTITIKGVKTNTTIFITAWDSAGSMSSDTIMISTKALPVITFSPVPGACANDTALIDLDSYVNPKGGSWYYDSNFLVGHKFSPLLSQDGSFWPRYSYTDPVSGCSDTDYINIIVYPSPVSSFKYQPSNVSVPVQINFTNNSIPVSGNYIEYLWDFGDGQFSTVKNPVHVFSQSGNLNVCLIVTDTVTKCSDRYCNTIQLLPYAGYLQMGGFVYAGAQKASHGKVFLYEQIDQSGKYSYKLTDSTNITDSNGYYYFSGVDSGIYLLKAILDNTSPLYAKYFPTYYGDDIFWKNSPVLNVVSNFYGYDIHLAAGNNISGTGNISGKTVSSGNPVSKIQVMLTDHSKKPILYDFSKTDGSFNMKDIGFGSYLLYTELTGTTTYPMEVSFDALHVTYENFYIEVVSQTGIDNPNEEELVFSSVYPNPVQGNGTLLIFSRSDHLLDITIHDLSGKVTCNQKGKLLPGENIISLKTDAFESGVYIYMIYVDGKFVSREKLLKIK